MDSSLLDQLLTYKYKYKQNRTQSPRSQTLKFHKLSQYLIPIFIVTTLGCGGGERPINHPPTIVAIYLSHTTQSGLAELDEVVLEADAFDPGGNPVTYHWNQLDGDPIPLTGQDTQRVTFIAPEVDQETNIRFELVVTDDVGVSTTRIRNLKIEDTLNFTISGKVIDARDSVNNVVIDVGRETIFADLDDDNNFTAELRIIESLRNYVMFIKSNGGARLSIIHDTGRLYDSRGDDDMVTADEHLGLNLNSLTSAFGRIMINAPGEALGTTELFLESFNKADHVKLLDYATIFHMTQSTSVELHPDLEEISQNTSFYALALDSFAAQAFLRTARLVAPETLEQSRQAVLSQEEGAITDELQFDYPVAQSYILNTSQYLLTDGQISFNQDGTGRYIHSLGYSDFTWQKTIDGLQLSHGVEGAIESETTDGILVQTISTSKNIKRLARTANGDIFILTNTTYQHYPNGEFEDSAPTNTTTSFGAIKQADFIASESIGQLSRTYSFPIPIETRGISQPLGEALSFSHSLESSLVKLDLVGSLDEGGTLTMSTPYIAGNGEVSYQQSEHTWSFADSHLIVDGDKQYDFTLMLHDEGSIEEVNTLVINADNLTSSTSVVLIDYNPSLTHEELTGIYYLPWYNEGHTREYWIELNSDSSALIVAVDDKGEDAQLLGDDYTQIPALWEINADGNMAIRTFASGSLSEAISYCTSTEFDPADNSDCSLYEEIEWDVHQVKDDEYRVLQITRTYKDAERQNMTNPPAGHLLGSARIDNRIWEKIEQPPFELTETH